MVDKVFRHEANGKVYRKMLSGDIPDSDWQLVNMYDHNRLRHAMSLLMRWEEGCFLGSDLLVTVSRNLDKNEYELWVRRYSGSDRRASYVAGYLAGRGHKWKRVQERRRRYLKRLAKKGVLSGDGQ